ncbi:hypothetical protein PanWU01x14_195630 [Parasponia andersonii]|uniref:Uncharacterized protein n=1 Tax=Parasponia andersonii TaxID=3476 RepID=A0A2P5BZW8_PARAD|nr:hypothetical protein PanWU01x14_195630 [Parasponia andersonii]
MNRLDLNRAGDAFGTVHVNDDEAIAKEADDIGESGGEAEEEERGTDPNRTTWVGSMIHEKSPNGDSLARRPRRLSIYCLNFVLRPWTPPSISPTESTPIITSRHVIVLLISNFLEVIPCGSPHPGVPSSSSLSVSLLFFLTLGPLYRAHPVEFASSIYRTIMLRCYRLSQITCMSRAFDICSGTPPTFDYRPRGRN